MNAALWRKRCEGCGRLACQKGIGSILDQQAIVAPCDLHQALALRQRHHPSQGVVQRGHGMDGAYAPACAQPLQCIEVGTLVKGRDRLEVQVLELGQHPEARVGQRVHGHRIAGPQQRTHGNVQSLLRAVDQEDAFRLGSQAAFAGKEVGHDAPLVQPAAGRLLVHERSQVARSSQLAQHGAQQPGLPRPGGMVEGQVGRVRTQAGFVAAIPFALLRPIPHKGAAPGFADDQAEGGQPRIHLAGGRHGHAMAGREVAVRGHQRAGGEPAGADVFGQPFSQQSNARGSHGV